MRHGIAWTLALLLAGCGGGDEGTGNNAAAAQNESEAAGAEAGGGASGGGETAADGGDVRMQAGQWEVTTEILAVNIPGMPPEAAAAAQRQPPTTVRTCLTEQQVAQPPADFLTGSGQDGGCTNEGMTVSGGRIQGTIQCNSQGGRMRTTLDGQFGPTSYQLTQEAEISSGGAPGMTTRVRTSGRRVGDCPGG